MPLCAAGQALSTGAAVGFGVAGTVVTEAVVALLFWVALKLRDSSRRRRAADEEERVMRLEVIGRGNGGKEMVSPAKVGSMVERWLKTEGMTRYSPVQLRGVEEEEREGVLPQSAYPARSAPPSRVPTIKARPVSKANLPVPPPFPTPQPPPTVAFYPPALAAALSSSNPPPQPQPYDPPLPPLQRRPDLSPLRIPSSSPPASRNRTRQPKPAPKTPHPSSAAAAKTPPAALPTESYFRRFSRQFNLSPPPPSQPAQKPLLKRPQPPTPPPFMVGNGVVERPSLFPSEAFLPFPTSSVGHGGSEAPSREGTLVASQEVVRRALREARRASDDRGRSGAVPPLPTGVAV
ncbi:hypothetical protein JCM8547_007626 [Rhodosporidiobolus lusitaniae]